MKGGKAGSFRAAFEDKVLLSDLIFLRAWLAVDLPRFYNPVTNLLAPAPARRARAPKVGFRADSIHLNTLLMTGPGWGRRSKHARPDAACCIQRRLGGSG